MQNELEKLFLETKHIDKMVKTAKVVVDTNVLLSAYQTKPVTFEAILTMLEELAEAERLKIPSHVIWEFNENRPERIKDIACNLQDFIGSLEKISNIPTPKKLNEILPAIDVLETSHIGEVIQSQEILREKLKEIRRVGTDFKAELQNLVSKMSNYLDDDPILFKYKEILEKAYYEGEEINESKLEELGKQRFKENIPPGFRDKAKGINKYGDLIIWLQICQINDDVIFITFDNKDDWVYTDNKKNVLGAKRELVQEFYKKTKGKTLKILHPSNFIDLYTEGQVSTDVTEELREYKSHIVTMPAGSGKSATWARVFSSIRQQEIEKLKEDCFYYEHEIHGYLELIRKNSAEEHVYSELNMQFELLRKENLMKLPELESYLKELMEFYEGIRHIYLKYFNQDEEK
ncbi:TPA: PIN-like domain-containing protein [Bacillus mycoides]